MQEIIPKCFFDAAVKSIPNIILHKIKIFLNTNSLLLFLYFFFGEEVIWRGRNMAYDRNLSSSSHVLLWWFADTPLSFGSSPSLAHIFFMSTDFFVAQNGFNNVLRMIRCDGFRSTKDFLSLFLLQNAQRKGSAAAKALSTCHRTVMKCFWHIPFSMHNLSEKRERESIVCAFHMSALKIQEVTNLLKFS